MKSNKKFFSFLGVTAAVCAPFMLMGCSTNVNADSPTQVYVTGIQKTDTSSDGENNYIITYSNGTQAIITIDSANSSGTVSIDELFRKYCEEHENATYEDFLREYLTVNPVDSRKVINECLNSCLKIYTEFCATTTSSSGFWNPTVQQKAVSVMCGSAVIYQMNKSTNPAENETYVITNYHVVYNSNANADNPNGKFARKIVGYLYGSESTPTQGQTGSDGYQTYDYGEYGIEFEYVGGSADHDIAILKTNTANILAINGNAKAVEFAPDYQVGETAIAIGNPENAGISVTEGVVSVDNEYIALNVDGTVRYHRSIRMDTAIYGGSSGGGLFNTAGKLIGITNAGNGTDQNINYAVPIDVVRPVTSNIMRNYDGTTPSTATKIKLGIQVQGTESKYLFDPDLKQSKIVEKIVIEKVEDDCLAKDELGLQVDDIIKAININDTTISLDRYFQIGDALLDIKAEDTISFVVERKNENEETQTLTLNEYTVKTTDLN